MSSNCFALYRAALSEGFIHQFFYCYRYFTTPAHIFNFLSEKFSAAALSLAPGEDIPSKVKARSMDLLQVMSLVLYD